MKSVLFSFIFLLSFSFFSCNLNVFEGPWDVNTVGYVTLYTRPLDYDFQPSPDSAVIQKVLENQNAYYDLINNYFNINYYEPVKIYLYNYDEALEVIGTNGGGAAYLSENSVVYTYFGFPLIGNNGEIVYIGKHELAHIITINALTKNGSDFDHSGTTFMREGYAVAVSGFYGAYRDNENCYRNPIEISVESQYLTDNIIPPSQLVTASRDDFYDLGENIAYPQAGFLIQWLIGEYGVDTINLLMNTPAFFYRAEFEEVTGESFEDMTQKYMTYLDDEFAL